MSISVILSGLAILGCSGVSEAALSTLRYGDHGEVKRLVLDFDEPLARGTVPLVEMSPDGRTCRIRVPAAAIADIGLALQSPMGGIVERADILGSGAEQYLQIGFGTPVSVKDQFLLGGRGASAERFVLDVVAAEPSSRPILLASAQEDPLSGDMGLGDMPGSPPQAPGIADEMGLDDMPPPPAVSPESDDILSGFVEVEGRWFPSDSDDGVSEHWFGSIAAEPALSIDLGRRHALRFVGFGRLDTAGDNRTHADIREANWSGDFGPFDVTVGIDRRFWGVTESVHLVDVINQTDFLEDVDDEDKLGQPMVSVAWTSGLGTLTGYVLPFFRERRFPGPDDRYNWTFGAGGPGQFLRIDRNFTQFESGDGDDHVDFAARYKVAAGPLDLGLHYFNGTSRDPRFVPVPNSLSVAPVYDLIDQTGVDAQLTLGALLLKGEAIYKWSDFENAGAFAAGVEYTLFGAIGGGDVGFLAEYLYDDRDASFLFPFEDDVFVGLRYTGNDVASTELLIGGYADMGNDGKMLVAEFSRRIGGAVRVSLDARVFTDASLDDPLYLMEDDDFIQLKLQYWF